MNVLVHITILSLKYERFDSFISTSSNFLNAIPFLSLLPTHLYMCIPLQLLTPTQQNYSISLLSNFFFFFQKKE